MKLYVNQKLRLVILIVLLPWTLFSQKDSTNYGVPKYILDDWENEVGTWIADNSDYKSEVEPYDAYGLDWRYGFAKKTLFGTLYCIIDGKNVGNVWEFFIYWDIENQKVKMIQTGSDGTIGKGTTKDLGGGLWQSEETFFGPDGNSFVSGHRMKLVDGKKHTESFNVVDGEWKKRRFYIWEKTE